MKKFKVMIDYKNFIPIDETELEKALKALAMDGKAFFANGATEKIHAVLPDYHAIMGWNYGYELHAEDYSLIEKSKECRDAKNLVSAIIDKIAGRNPSKELKEIVNALAESMRIKE